MTVQDILSVVTGDTDIVIYKDGRIIRDFIKQFHDEDAQHAENGYRWKDVLDMNVLCIEAVMVDYEESTAGLALSVE